MTQSQIKHTTAFAGTELERSGRTPISVRVSDGVIEPGNGHAPRLAVENDVNQPEDTFAGFVFEEAVAAAPTPSVREPGVAGRPPEPAKGEASVATELSAIPRIVPTPKVSSRQSATQAPATGERNGKEANKAEQTTASTSNADASRRYLELRTQLHQKDEELFSLRSEINGRDRQLLDYSNKLLEVERARTELGDLLDETTRLLKEAGDKIRAFEAEREASAKRTEEMKALFRRSEDSWKRKTEKEIKLLTTTHATEIGDLNATHAVKLDQINAAHAAEFARMNAARAAAEEEASERHSAAMKAAESAANSALSNAIAAYTRRARSLQEVQERALAKSEAAHTGALEAALAAAASEKAVMLAEAEIGMRVAQNELSATQATVQFLERGQTAQLDKINTLQTKVTALEERTRHAEEKLEADAEIMSRLRQALSAGLNLLNTQRSEPEGS